jgi:hypothetical protein
VTVATYSLTTSPITIDDGTSYSVLVTNTGAATVELSRGGRLRPNQAQTVYPEGAALTAAAVTGTSSVSTSTTTKPLPNAADPAALAANAAFTGTYAAIESVTLNDNFTRSDGALGSDPASGYWWATSGGTTGVISGNKLVASAHAQTMYAQIALERAPIEMRGTLSYVAGGGTDASPSALVLASSSVAYQAPWYLIHTQFTQTGYLIQTSANSVFVNLASGNWTTPVPIDGTVKSVKVRIVGNTLTLTGPNGETVSVTDASIGATNGRYCFWSIEPQDANSPKGRWHSATATEARTGSTLARARDLWIPDRGIAESIPRYLAAQGTLTPLTSGTVYAAAIDLPPGVPINWLEWFSTAVAAVTPTHQWAVLMDLAGRVVSVSSDLTTTAWAASTAQRFPLTSQYTAPVSGPGIFWAGLCVVAGTVPGLCGVSTGQTGPSVYAPRPYGASSASQTTPPTVGTLLSIPAVSNTGWPYVVAG